MILPSIVPMVGLVLVVLTLFHFSQKRSQLVEQIRQTYEKQKADYAAADREADRRLLQDLARTDQPERLIKARLDERSAVIPNRHQDPGEWTEVDLFRWLNGESAYEIKMRSRPILIKGVTWVILIVVCTVVAVILCFKANDWMSRPVMPSSPVNPMFNSDSGDSTTNELSDSFFTDEGRDE